ncbi:hypothetical protein A0O28_0062940 [Trichoderma guizhouense]|uniref:Ice-binding protein n=1 Tax=Trichoderma guizhouense TaxID=1491466 RepID=A0A1T3CYJ9_9HYPO|nr:hypothetical protein A0O28_0062940 [Trichoderma guizhouense]
MLYLRFLGSALALAGVIKAQVDLGTALSFAVLGGSAVTNTGPSIISGNVGVSPGSAISGFPPGVVVNGMIHMTDALAAQAQADVTTAYNVAAGLQPNTDLTGQDLGGMTLVAGVYSFSSSAQLTGPLVLDGQGDSSSVWVFQIGSTLTTATASSVILIGGASPCNVFWQVGSSATIGTTTTFVGNVLALTSITLVTGASSNGGLYARNGAYNHRYYYNHSYYNSHRHYYNHCKYYNSNLYYYNHSYYNSHRHYNNHCKYCNSDIYYYCYYYNSNGFKKCKNAYYYERDKHGNSQDSTVQYNRHNNKGQANQDYGYHIKNAPTTITSYGQSFFIETPCTTVLRATVSAAFKKPAPCKDCGTLNADDDVHSKFSSKLCPTYSREAIQVSQVDGPASESTAYLQRNKPLLSTPAVSKSSAIVTAGVSMNWPNLAVVAAALLFLIAIDLL